ncbi:MAG: ATP-dependent helicase, partial [Muribaculaceae bacterium]|nr:ATP-dependent helicase [Muribaculaceae bacterium]
LIDKIFNRIEIIKRNRYTKEEYFNNLEQNPDWVPQLNKYRLELEEKRKKGAIRTATLEKNIKEQEDRIAKAKELWDFYELYKSKMEKNRYLDFNDMIGFVLDKFELSPGFLDKIANNYEYILVDEYQDTNQSQNSIVFNLTKALKSENVFVVGDDDQIIYGFQGARIDTIEKFLTEFPQTQVICLKNNMRSTQNILEASRAIVKQDSTRLEANPKFEKYNISKELISVNENLKDKNIKVRCYKYADILQEYNEIVDEIEALINSENCPTNKDSKEKDLSQIAILAKSNAELDTFAELLKSRNIPFELKEGKSIFSIKSSIVLYYYLQMLVNPELNSDKIFKLLLNKPFSIHPKDYAKLFENSSIDKTFIDSMKKLDPSEFVEPERIKNFTAVYDYLQGYKSSETLKNIVLEVGAKTGIFDYYLNSEINRCENIAGLKKLTDEACDFSDISKTVNLEDFVEYLDIAFKDDIEIKTAKAPVPLNAIQLSTYYSAKGREFEYVYMPTLLAKNWENKREQGRYDVPVSVLEYKNEDERKCAKSVDCIKLLYVGMTRAKHTLRLSYPESINGKAQNPTTFITEIQELFEKEPTPFSYDVESFWNQIQKSVVKRDYDYKQDFCMMVDNILRSKNFSPSSFNIYMKCPRQYMYSYILNLASKDKASDSLSYGSAVHAACEFAVSYAKKSGNYPEKNLFIQEFKNELSKLPMTSREQREIHTVRGEKALDTFYSHLCQTPIENLFEVEKTIEIELDGIKFKGIIDRIDKNSDGTYSIYDYKTGKAKSSKNICDGGEHEDYYNQIGLYKYYFEKITGGKVKDTTFIFPEEFTKNLSLSLTDEDCQNILQKFKTAIADIREYKFEPVPNRNTSKQPCQYCQYQEFCNLEIV